MPDPWIAILTQFGPQAVPWIALFMVGRWLVSYMDKRLEVDVRLAVAIEALTHEIRTKK